MDDGKTFRIVYTDGKADRVKTLIFKKREPPLIHFINPKTGKEEILNEANIIRMEEMDNGFKRC